MKEGKNWKLIVSFLLLTLFIPTIFAVYASNNAPIPESKETASNLTLSDRSAHTSASNGSTPVQLNPSGTCDITFHADPSSIGTSTFNGTVYTDEQTDQHAAGTQPVQTNAPSSQIFKNWATTGDVSKSGSIANVANAGTAYVYGHTAPSSIQVDYPVHIIAVSDDPTIASVIIIWMNPYPPLPTTVWVDNAVTRSGSGPLYNYHCPEHSPQILGDWQIELYFINTQGTIVGHDGFAVSIADSVKYTVSFYTDPSTDGSITFNGTTYTNGQTGQYEAGTYSIQAHAPLGWTFYQWGGGGSISAANFSFITMTGPCSIKAFFLPLPVNLTVVIVTNGGSDYTTPAILLEGGGSTGATATAHVSNGVIYAITLTNTGTGYFSAPTVIIRDPSPRANGAAAIVTSILS
jgi:hypothetical protein